MISYKKLSLILLIGITLLQTPKQVKALTKLELLEQELASSALEKF